MTTDEEMSVLGRVLLQMPVSNLLMPNDIVPSGAPDESLHPCLFTSVALDERRTGDEVVQALAELAPDTLEAKHIVTLPLFTAPHFSEQQQPQRATQADGEARGRVFDDEVGGTTTMRSLSCSAQHIREVCVLNCLLQRVRWVYSRQMTYFRLMYVLREKDLVRRLLECMRTVWVLLQHQQPLLDPCWPHTLLSLYVDTMVLYVLHCNDESAGGDVTARPVGALSAAQVEECLRLAHELDLYACARSADGENERLRRCATLLTCAAVQQMLTLADTAAVPLGVLSSIAQDAQAHRGGPDPITHAACLASIPVLVHGGRGVASTGSSGGGSSEGGDMTSGTTSQWLVAAMQLACNTTVYDTDVASLFYSDDAQTPLLRSYVMNTLAHLYAVLWATLGSGVWRHFQANALLSAAHSMRLYAFLWQRTLACTLRTGLMLYARHNLWAHLIAGSSNHDEPPAGAAARSSPATSVAAAATAASAASARDECCYCLTTGQTKDMCGFSAPTAIPSRVDGVPCNMMGETGVESETTQRVQLATKLTFASESARCMFFFTVYTYAAAALPYLCAHFDSCKDEFVWHVDSNALRATAPTPPQASSPRSGSYSGASYTYSTSPTIAPAPPCGSHRVVPFPLRLMADEAVVNFLTTCFNLLVLRLTSHKATTPPDFVLSDADGARFDEAATALLYGLLLEYRHDLTTLDRFLGPRYSLLSLGVTVCQVYLPRLAELPSAMARTFYTFLGVYHAAMGNPYNVAAALLPPRLTHRCGSGRHILFQSHLYHILYQQATGEASGIRPQRILRVLGDLPEGAIARTSEGAVVFVHLMRALCELLQRRGDATRRLTVRDLLGRHGEAACDGEDEVRVTSVVTRLCEGAAMLWDDFDRGLLFHCQTSVVYLLTITVHVLHEVLRSDVDEGGTALVTCVLPERQLGVSRTAAVLYLLRIIFDERLPLQTCATAATALGAALVRCSKCECCDNNAVGTSRNVSDMYAILRAHTLPEARRWLAEAVLRACKAEYGSTKNIVRLTLLRALQVHDEGSLCYLFGPDLTVLREVVDEVLAGGDAQVGRRSGAMEKALALELVGDSAAATTVALERTLGLLAETQTSQDIVTALLLAASAVGYANGLLAARLAKDSRAGGDGRTGSGSGSGAPPSQRTRGGAVTEGNSPPIMRPQGATAASTAVGGGGVNAAGRGGNMSETVERLLRQGGAVLLRGCELYERLERSTYYEDGSGSAADATSLLLRHPGDDNEEVDDEVDTTTTRMAAGRDAVMVVNGLASASVEAHALSRQLWEHAPRMDSTAVPQVGTWSAFSTVDDAIGGDEDDARQPFPLLLGERYDYFRTGVAHRDGLNRLAAVLEAMTRLSAALEATVWLSGWEPDISCLFVSRNAELLLVALRAAFVFRPGAPLLAPARQAMLRRSMRLAKAVVFVAGAGVTEGAMSRATTLGLRRAFYTLFQFMLHNGASLAVVNDGIALLRWVQLSSMEYAAMLESVFRLLLWHCTAGASRTEASATDNAALLADRTALIDSVGFLFANFAAHCPVDVALAICPALLRCALAVSPRIIAVAAVEGWVGHLVQLLRCTETVLLQSMPQCLPGLVAATLPREQLVGLLLGLGDIRGESALRHGVGYVRQAWHAAWCATLHLWQTVLLCTSGGDGEKGTAEEDWAGTAARVLPSCRRFMSALGGLCDTTTSPTTAGSSAVRYFIWDVEEMAACTRLAALICINGHATTFLTGPREAPETPLTMLRQSFSLVHRHRLLRSCIIVDGNPVATARGVELLVTHMIRDQLTCFLLSPSHYGSIVSSVNDGPGGRAATNLAVSVTFDTLRHFVVQQLQRLRHSGLVDTARGTVTEWGSTTNVTSRESSVQRGASLTEGDATESTVEDSHVVLDALTETVRENRALHVDTAQLALCLFTLAVREAIESLAETGSAGLTRAGPFRRELRTSSEKLLHMLENARADLRHAAPSPGLQKMVDLMCDRLHTVLALLT